MWPSLLRRWRGISAARAWIPGLGRVGLCTTKATEGAQLEDPDFHRVTQLLYLESCRILLDCIFTPQDRSNTTGPVVGGVHDAFRRLRHHWEGTAWLLKIDLMGLEKLLYNPLILQSIGAKVEPGKMMEMIQKLQGSNALLSHTLANAHLQQLDLLIAKIQRDCQAQRNRRIHPVIKRAPELLDPTSINATKFERMGAIGLGDKNFVRIRYVRHADEILVGIAANREFAERVSQRICAYISDALGIELQANLTHVSEEPPMFLGVRVAPYAATKFARRFIRELESRRRIRKRVMLRAAQREAAWNNKLRKLALSALATGIKKTRLTLGPTAARKALEDKCTQLAHKFILDPANADACRQLLRDAETIEKTFAEELGWISLPSEVREAHERLTSVIRKHIRSMR